MMYPRCEHDHLSRSVVGGAMRGAIWLDDCGA